jgi:hypothetical protein
MRIWTLLFIGIMLLGMLTNNTLGVGGSPCSPCDTTVYDWNGHFIKCVGCITDCGLCYDCNMLTTPPSCHETYDQRAQDCCPDSATGKCKSICDWKTACTPCDSNGSGNCKFFCDPHQCQTCDGNGNCLVCGGDPNRACCNGTCYDTTTQGCCGGTIYNKTTQKCCEDISPSYICDINVECCNGSCCDSNQACCNGECYDKKTQRCCHNQAFDEYFICDANKTCCSNMLGGNSCCDPELCESCVGGWVGGVCQVCGGDDTKKCCPGGSCATKCALEANTATCTGETVPCPDCLTYCEENYKTVWSGNSTYTCKAQGCPGDCQDDTVLCYTNIPCKTNVIYKWLCVGGTCFCFCCDLECPAGSACYQCIPTNTDVEEFPAPSKKCGG